MDTHRHKFSSSRCIHCTVTERVASAPCVGPTGRHEWRVACESCGEMKATLEQDVGVVFFAREKATNREYHRDYFHGLFYTMYSRLGSRNLYWRVHKRSEGGWFRVVVSGFREPVVKFLNDLPTACSHLYDFRLDAEDETILARLLRRHVREDVELVECIQFDGTERTPTVTDIQLAGLLAAQGAASSFHSNPALVCVCSDAE
eukprot:GDKI01006881.1.p1 GENE.GDKI01006881.1~~GDKI01006881.1.p1  ORF type:complete len:237 (+),score=22.77 GDKI01006881.1:105-713(+)